MPVSLRLDEDIEDLAFGVDCAPEIDHPTTDFQIDLVQMPDPMHRTPISLSGFMPPMPGP